MSKVYSAGIATAYGAAKKAGYQGTYQQFCEDQANFASNAASVARDKTAAQTAASNAESSATAASTAAGTATTAAGSAQSYAQAASGSASTASAEALKAEGWASGKQNGQDVPSSSPYYHKSAKYYADYAKDTYDSIPAGYDNMIVVSDTQPQDEHNKVWFPDEDGSEIEEISIPTNEEFVALQSALNKRNEAVTIYQNLVDEVIVGKYATQDVADGPIYIRDSETRSYCCIPVVGGGKYAINMDISANFSWWAHTSQSVNGTGISKVTVDANHVATAPSNANLLYITVNSTSADLVVINKNESVYGKTSADFPVVTIPSLVEKQIYELRNVDVSTIYDSELSFTWDANNNALVISSNWAGNNLFIVTSNEGKKTLTVTELGTKSWSIPHNGYLVYLYDSDTFAIKTTIDDLAVPYVILAHVTDNGQGTGGNLQVSGNWEKYWIKYGLSNRIGILEGEINDILDDLPAYYYANDYFPNKLQSVRDGMNYKNGICFAFITDTHFQENSLQSRKMLSKIMQTTQVPFVVFGGDAPRLFGDMDGLDSDIAVLQSYADAVGRCNWYAVRGNHDFYDRTDEELVADRTYYTKTEGEVYNLLMKSSERRMTNGDPDHMCYYIDIPAQKTRIIVLNTTDPQGTVDEQGHTLIGLGSGAVSEEQAAWLVATINAVEDTNIIVITHIPTDLTLAGEEATHIRYARWILKAFAAGTDVESKIGGVQYTFTGTTNKLICSISGHNHKDQWSAGSGFLNIVTMCDARYNYNGYPQATNGTITEQAFDVYFINYEDKTVKTVRFGRGNNRAWNYENGTVIT